MTALRGVRISTLLFAGVLVYFAVHAFVGQQGLLSWRAYVERADRLTQERDTLIARREALETKVGRLHGSAPDSDYLEERAFAQLRLLKPNDVVIALPPPGTEPAGTQNIPTTAQGTASLPAATTGTDVSAADGTAANASMQTPNP
jgi:cell division protein FtsB